jgi:hypothetical protein
MDRDAALAFRILVEVGRHGALRRRSMIRPRQSMAIDQLHDLLAQRGSRRLDVGDHRDSDGRLRA